LKADSVFQQLEKHPETSVNGCKINVNPLFSCRKQLFLGMQFKSVLTFSALTVLVLILLSSCTIEDAEFQQEKEQLVMRKIGHEILLLTGDSTSRVLPVKQFKNGTYQLQFESSFAFLPDSLLTTIQRIVVAHQLPPDYLVNVIECSEKKVVFGYAISENAENNILACTSRKQPLGCYLIHLQFQSRASSSQAQWAIVGLVVLVGSLLTFGTVRYYRRKKVNLPQTASELENEHCIRIGNYLFLKQEQCLLFGEEKIELTIKEAELLFIFATRPNQIIDRVQLQKEVWEDNGVIVGRSLDVFISKLRKKLEQDISVRLINIHGKGYRLEVG